MFFQEGRYVVFDFETTGLSSVRGGRVIEIGAVAIEGRHIVDEFHSLVNPQVPIPWSAQRIHGISREDLEGEPEPDEVFPRFVQFLGGAVLVAHNAPFDIGFLKAELGLLGMGLNSSHFCTLKMSRKLYPQLVNHKLETVARHLLGKIPDNLQLHRALEDARLTAQVWLKILNDA